MGKRGPKIGTKYQKRVRITRPLSVASDRQLVAAQRFTERLRNWLSELETCEQFPLSDLEPLVVQRVLDAAGQLEGAVIDGIYRYMTHEGE